jgi:acetylornithine deacetylase/succinyl-diaminopimelate desuccinylase-like protein
MSLQYATNGIWQDSSLVVRAQEIGAQFATTVLETAQEIARVSAPTGHEANRAEFVSRLFQAHGVPDVSTDDIHNVVGRHRSKSESETAVLLAAHIDTVFAHGTTLNIWTDGARAYGPGLGDNSLGVAAVVHLPEMLAAIGAPLEVDLLLTGNVGEEGLGNLRGVTRVLDDHPEIGAMVAVEGQNLGRITHIAVGSQRLRITVTGPGGHSWGDFGNPNAIHAAASLIDALARIPLTQSPKTTLSVGTITGGISINSIAPDVTFDLDLRSTDPVSLRRLIDRVYAALTPRDDRISVTIDVIGSRPAGQVPAGSRVVTSAAEILRLLGYPASADASSTDANAAISRGIPAICIGMTTGANAHRLEEYVDIDPIGIGLAQLSLLTLSLAHDLKHGLLKVSQ